MSDDEIVDAILIREGSAYTNHPADRGGPTKFGITQETLNVFRGKPVSPEDVEHLSATEAREIYKQKYIKNAGFGAIKDSRLKAFVIDSAVNHGILTAVKLLQRALRVKDDGILGPETRKALDECSASRVHLQMIGQRAMFYGAILTKDPSQCVFAKGWMNRLNDCIEEFLS